MRILGIDPALASCGYCILLCAPGRHEIKEAGVITTPADETLGERLHSLRGDVIQLYKRFQPNSCAIEKPFFIGRNTNAGVVVNAVGVITEALALCGLELTGYPPSSIKKAVTGDGRADKAKVKRALRDILGIVVSGADDASDAVAVALTHAIKLGV